MNNEQCVCSLQSVCSFAHALCHHCSGDNQRLELLGDTVLKFVTSDYLMRHFPRHHEGHLSLLRSALVNRTTEAIVCDELCKNQLNCLCLSRSPFSNGVYERLL